MTPERVAYYERMLLIGIREEFDIELNHALETEAPLSDLVLELAFCMSDTRQTISALHQETLRHQINELEVYRMVLEWAGKQYMQKCQTTQQLVDILYKIAMISDDAMGEPWHCMTEPYFIYDEVIDGYFTQESFDSAFENYILYHKPFVIPWSEQKATKKKQNPILWLIKKTKGETK